MNNYFLTFLNCDIFKKFSETRISDSIFLKKYSATIIVSSKNFFIPNPSVSNLLPQKYLFHYQKTVGVL